MKSSGLEEHELVLRPYFSDGAAGRVFCVFVGPPPGAPRRGGVLFVPPFAEEMNKTRRQVMLQARALAAAGFGVLLMDLLGTGDSSGEFADGRLPIWREDLLGGVRSLEREGFAPAAVWGLRWGALLATDVARIIGVTRLVLWQPAVDGRQYMDQFIRLRTAATMLRGTARETVQDLRKLLAAGQALEVAGYELHPEVVAAIDGQSLSALRPPPACTVDWVETVRDADTGVSVGSQRIIDGWRQTGVEVRSAAVVGQQFWATVEITVAPALIEHTTQSLSGRA